MDKILPSLTIYERGELFNILSVPILYMINYYFKNFEITIEDEIMSI